LAARPPRQLFSGEVMETRSLGSSDLRVSLVGLGCNNFGARLDLEGTRRVAHKAIDLGITLFDTADTYGNQGGSETFLGEVLGPRRKEIVLATKFGKPMDREGKMKGAAPTYIKSALDASLKRLKTDWIDLYQSHDPDPNTPIAETLETLEAAKKAGKIRAYGCSNYSAAQVREAEDTAKRMGLTGFVTFQDEYSLLKRQIEQDLISTGANYGMGLLPFFPLANGLLTGKYQRDAVLPTGSRLANNAPRAAKLLTDKTWRQVEGLTAFCESRGRSLLELAFSWLACRRPVVSVIAGATTPEQIAANVKAADWKLGAEDMAEIDRITGS
jgi:aryl-alcohol dehydrogenase-like predicted oxidoreductase